METTCFETGSETATYVADRPMESSCFETRSETATYVADRPMEPSCFETRSETATYVADRPMEPSCLACDLGLDHCHGIVVEHHDGTFECTDGCGGGLAVHDDVVTCFELGQACCQTLVLDDDVERLAVAA